MKKVKVVYSFQSFYKNIATDIDPFREYCFYTSILGVRKYLPGAEIVLVADKETVNFLRESGTYGLIDTVKEVSWQSDYNLGSEEYLWFSPKWLGLSILPVEGSEGVLFSDLDAIPISPMEKYIDREEYFSQECRPEDGGLKHFEKAFREFSPWNGFVPERQGCGGFIYFPDARIAKVVSMVMLHFQRCIARGSSEKVHQMLCNISDSLPSYYCDILLGEEHMYPAVTEAIVGKKFVRYEGIVEHLGLHCRFPEHRDRIIASVKKLLNHFPESKKYYSSRLEEFCEDKKLKMI